MAATDEQEPGRRRSLFGDVLVPGLMVGAFGAALMAVAASAISAASGHPAWTPEALVAGLFYRHADPVGMLPVLLGLAVHFAVAVGVATGFAALLPRGGTQMAAMLLGVCVGLLLQAVMPQLIVPFASPALERFSAHGAMFFLHLLLGVTLGLVPAVRGIFSGFPREETVAVRA